MWSIEFFCIGRDIHTNKINLSEIYEAEIIGNGNKGGSCK